MRGRTLAAGAASAALLVAGCGGKQETKTISAQTTTTRVEILKDAGDAQPGGGSVDPSAIYQRESPGVVTITSTGLDNPNGSGQNEAGVGSGFVISGNGEIATNAHVVTSGEGASIHKAQQVYVRFKDNNQVSAEIVGFDPFSDVALLKVDPAGLTLRPLPLGSARDVIVGAPVAAIGSPFGKDESLSVGVVSALDRSIDSLTGFATTGAIQTDAAINHGNSGGPLLDMHGDVIGVNSQIESDSGGNDGVGFAVPSNTISRIAAALIDNGSVEHAYLGVAIDDSTSTAGARLAEVRPGTPAARAGLKSGDVITKVAGTSIGSADELRQLVDSKQPGDKVVVTVKRNGATKTVTVTLGSRPSA